MTPAELEQWLIRQLATNISVIGLPLEATARLLFDVGSNRTVAVLDALDRYLYVNAPCGVVIYVVCRNTYTGVVTRETMPRPATVWPMKHDDRQRLHDQNERFEVRLRDMPGIYYPRHLAMYSDGI